MSAAGEFPGTAAPIDLSDFLGHAIAEDGFPVDVNAFFVPEIHRDHIPDHVAL